MCSRGRAGFLERVTARGHGGPPPSTATPRSPHQPPCPACLTHFGYAAISRILQGRRPARAANWPRSLARELDLDGLPCRRARLIPWRPR